MDNNKPQRRPLRKPPPNYFSRSVQIRLLVLVSMFMLVVVMMNEAAKPQTWYWLWGKPIQGEIDKNNNGQERFTDDTPIDSRLKSKVNRRRSLSDNEIVALPGRTQDEKLETESKFNEDSLDLIRDDSIFLPQEQESWFGLLGELKQSERSRLEENSLGLVGFQQLFRQSEEYRGKLITVRGTLRLLYYVEAPNNSVSIDGYYVLWLKPEGGSKFPIVTYCLDIPTGFPEVKESQERVTTFHEPVVVTGFFFKRWAYQAKDDIRTVPLILAKIPQWHKRAVLEKAPIPNLKVIMIAVCGLGLLAIIVTLRIYYSRQRHLVTERFLLPTLSEDEQIKKLQNLELGPSVEASLKQLADQEKADK